MYPYRAFSPSDPNIPKGLGYNSLDEAQTHANNMNKIISTYPINWNINYWKTKPQLWTIEYV